MLCATLLFLKLGKCRCHCSLEAVRTGTVEELLFIEDTMLVDSGAQWNVL